MAVPEDPIGDERRERLRLESILGDVLPRFVSVPADDIDRAIVETQRRFVEALDIDRSDLFSPGPGDDMVLSHSWHRPGAPPAELGLSAARFLPWCLGRVRRGEEVIFASVRDLPPEAATDLEGIRQFGPRSTVAFPLLIGGRPCGAVTFAAVRAERRWPDRIVERLRLVASVFANALSRKGASEAVRESESRLT
ncbi:MAG TPA: GAF domain-containing protein, partial [Humisphaera sp.]